MKAPSKGRGTKNPVNTPFFAKYTQLILKYTDCKMFHLYKKFIILSITNYLFICKTNL